MARGPPGSPRRPGKAREPGDLSISGTGDARGMSVRLPWAAHGLVAGIDLIQAIRCSARARNVLPAHLANLVLASLRLGDGKSDGSHTFYRPFFSFGSALLCVHEFSIILSLRIILTT